MLNLDPNISVCHRCPHNEMRQPGFKGSPGPIACTADPARRDIKERAAAGDCEFFTEEGWKAASARQAPAPAPSKPCCGHKILHGAVAMAKVAAQTVGIPIDQSPRDVEANRLRLCTPCDRNQGMTCAECKCIIRLKIRVKSEVCPLGKW